MDTYHLRRAEEYYKYIGEKNSEEIKKYLHLDVEFYAPLATLKGKQAVLESTSNFMTVFKSLTIRAKFSDEKQAMVVYETDIPGIGKSLPGASLLSFKDGLIIKIELFHDASHFKENK